MFSVLSIGVPNDYRCFTSVEGVAGQRLLTPGSPLRIFYVALISLMHLKRGSLYFPPLGHDLYELVIISCLLS